jgi:hypothetical protein
VALLRPVPTDQASPKHVIETQPAEVSGFRLFGLPEEDGADAVAFPLPTGKFDGKIDVHIHELLMMWIWCRAVRGYDGGWLRCSFLRALRACPVENV